MPQPSKIPLAFAASGDKNVIPENTETTGLASWSEGFPAITSAPFSEGGIAPKRADFNGIFYALSQAVMWMQQGGLYAYDVNTNYEAGNVVLDAGGLYVANAANGPSSSVVQPSSDTTGATWKLVRLNLATQTAAGYMSAEDKVKLDGVNNIEYKTLTATGAVTLPHSSICAVQDHVCYISLSFTLSATPTNWNSINVFKSPVLPKFSINGAINNQDGTIRGLYLEILDNGDVNLHFTGGQLPTNNYYHGILVFPC